MILHNCLSGHTARLALWEEQREASTPAPGARRSLRGGWPSSFQRWWCRLHVHYSSPLQYFLTGSSTWNAHTRPLHAPERAGRSSNMREQEVFPGKLYVFISPASVNLFLRSQANVTELRQMSQNFPRARQMSKRMSRHLCKGQFFSDLP